MTLEPYVQEFKIYWIKYPLLRLLIPFVLGILIRDSVRGNVFILGMTMLLLIMGLVLVHFMIKTNLELIPWFGLLTTVFFFVFGLFWSTIRNEANQQNHFKVESHVSLITKVYYVEEKDRFWDCYSDVLFQKESQIWNQRNGKLLIRVSKTTSYIPNSRDILYGAHRLLKPDHNSAPFEFDWAALLDHRNIHYITYLDTSKFQILEKAELSFLEKSRIWSDNIILSVFGNNRDYPVATAMLLGLRKKIDPELYRAYSATGAVHVLAVSGLHVGILAKIIELFFGFFTRKFKAKKIVLPAIVIICIWLYTILTGATPSILRSALMFSLFILGRLLQKDAQPLNILAAAAWVLLVINPGDLYNIGFQLSFGAMAGIFILYEPIRVLWPIENKVMQIIWEITAVSLAAQLFIYPLVGYHFHQFAFYFWLTSLVSSPFSYLIIGAGVIIFPIKAMGLSFLYWIDYILIYSVKWMNDIIAWLYTLPMGRLKGWWPSYLDCLLLILISILIGSVLKKRNYSTLTVFICSLILLFTVMSFEKIVDSNKSEIIASSFRGKNKVWIKYKNSIVQLIGDSSIFNSNYADKYDILANEILILDSISTLVVGDELEVKKNMVKSNSQLYKIIPTSREKIDTNLIESNANLIIMNKYWKPDDKALNTKIKIYCFDTTQAEKLKSYYPASHSQYIDRSFIQLPVR